MVYRSINHGVSNKYLDIVVGEALASAWRSFVGEIEEGGGGSGEKGSFSPRTGATPTGPLDLNREDGTSGAG